MTHLMAIDCGGFDPEHAAKLHLLGFNHEKLTYRYSGRDFRLTDVYGNVVKQVVG
jgi:hypothetical protein